MLKAKEILRLKHEVGLSLREIGKSCNCGKSTVSEVLERARDAGIKWPTSLSDKKLLSMLYPPVKNSKPTPEPDMEYVFYEMKKKSVTLMLLWEEYKKAHPDGVMYTQFCERYRKFNRINDLTMHMDHKSGEEVQVDWAGQTIPYTDVETGERKEAYIFVAVLPASSYPFARAYCDTTLANWTEAHVMAYEYFGGVPRITIPDNEKTAVTTPDLFDPVLNKSYYAMASHYNTTILPARPGKPRDKASCENMVGSVSRRIIAALRNFKFFSVYEINLAIEELLVDLVNRPFQKMEGNRVTAFEKIDKPFLQPLPSTRYEYSEWKETKVQFNYHVEYSGFFYSVDSSCCGKSCSVRATSKTIEIYIDSERVAAYPRNYNIYKRYMTLPEHMPEEHKVISGWSSERFLTWAATIGPNICELIKRVLESREFPVQTYRACMGIMRLCKGYSNEIVETAGREAIENNTCSYKYFSMILKQTAIKNARARTEKIIRNDNVRGSGAYEGGGINA